MKKLLRSISFFLALVAVLSAAFYLLVVSFGNDKSLAENDRIPSHMLSRITTPDGPGSIPADWMDRQRSYPYGRIKPEFYLSAMRQAQVLHNSTLRSTDVNWEFAGPLNIGGRITDIEMPTGSFSTIYIGAASGGIFKTTNNGASWVNIFQDAATLPIGDLAIDPNNADVIWAGTGEANASSQSFRGDGIYKSTDAGETWQNMGLELAGYFGRIIVDHANSNRVFAAVCGNLFTPDPNRGIYRTEDGGLTWEKVLFVNDSVSGIDIVQHPVDPNILYAAMWERMRGLNYRRSFGPGSGIWKSVDGGDTWTLLEGGLPTGNSIGRIGLAISPSSPNILYSFIDREEDVAVFRTQNAGQTWVRTNDFSIQGMNSNFGWYFGQIRVHPTNPDVAYIQGVDLYYTVDAGNTWLQLAGYFNGDVIHVDRHAMYIHPVTGRVLEGNDGGLYFSDDSGFSWTKMNNLPLTQFYDIETDYLKPERIYGGTQDNNSIRTTTGNTDEWQAILGGDGFYSLVNPQNSNIIYAEYQWGGLNKSNNGGSYMYGINGYWSNDRVNWSAPVIMRPNDPDLMYFGTYRVWKSTNGGESWTAVSGDLTDGDDGSTFHTITTLACSPVNGNYILAGTDDARVHISINGGGAWTDISDGLPDRWITRVAFDPFDGNTIYATCSGFRWDETLPHVFKSTDLGQTWESISGNLPELPVNAFIADPSMHERYFVGTDAGVFWTKDGGLQWESLNGTLGNVPVTSMKIHDSENFLLIGTYGLGAYKLDLAQLTVGTKNINSVSGLSISSIYPQPYDPSIGLLNISIQSDKSSPSTISITDLNGKVVYYNDDISLQQGSTLLRFNKNLKPGIYLISVKSQGRQVTEKILAI